MRSVRRMLVLTAITWTYLLAQMCSANSDSEKNANGLYKKLQTCFSVSGMDELDVGQLTRGGAPRSTLETVPTVRRRREILEGFLDCCSKEDFPADGSPEHQKQPADGADSTAAQLTSLQQKIQTIYKKYLMGSSVGVDFHRTA